MPTWLTTTQMPSISRACATICNRPQIIYPLLDIITHAVQWHRGSSATIGRSFAGIISATSPDMIVGHCHHPSLAHRTAHRTQLCTRTVVVQVEGLQAGEPTQLLGHAGQTWPNQPSPTPAIHIHHLPPYQPPHSHHHPTYAALSQSTLYALAPAWLYSASPSPLSTI